MLKGIMLTVTWIMLAIVWWDFHLKEITNSDIKPRRKRLLIANEVLFIINATISFVGIFID